ncbi:hypothetical protein MUB04_14275 [Acinetobacter indicus]|uniref:hypothetical protein n=1 Tax=Acinetobacter TaxID=469 RepID=UPI0015D1FE2F|nr:MULTISPECIES: hypothetical protein [Acinetobacter]MCP0917697.1 hypothetical protein [Acinetobacter indicus]
MKTHEVYTATLMDLREVDSKVFTQTHRKDIQALLDSPNTQSVSLLNQAKKEILQWTYGSLPMFYNELSKPTEYSNYTDEYPFMIMFAVQGMEIGEIQRPRYEEWKRYIDHMTIHVAQGFSQSYSEKYKDILLSDNDREALKKALYEAPRYIHELQFTVKRLEKIKAQYPTASKIIDPMIKFYQEWDVFSHVNNELKKLCISLKVMVDTSKLGGKSDSTSDQHTSDIEQIGRTLYGEIWVAQLARNLVNEKGKSLPQSTLKSMRDRNNLPLYIQKQLPAIYEERLAELKTLESLIYPDRKKQET